MKKLVNNIDSVEEKCKITNILLCEIVEKKNSYVRTSESTDLKSLNICLEMNDKAIIPTPRNVKIAELLYGTMHYYIYTLPTFKKLVIEEHDFTSNMHYVQGAISVFMHLHEGQHKLILPNHVLQAIAINMMVYKKYDNELLSLLSVNNLHYIYNVTKDLVIKPVTVPYYWLYIVILFGIIIEFITVKYFA